ncbi:TolB family protein [Nocardioides dongkuii]|uniref:TolB family protein n=1 Tax=Nocardioides dongkuii TaxID=2760089 RepID=UPI0015F96E11|nr:PD40 domain-containing protein [Nocardioides dongkuii]
MSDDGRYVAFESSQVMAGDTNEGPDVFLADTTTGTSTLVSRAPDGSVGNGWSGGPEISANGKFVVFSSPASNLTADSVGTTDLQVFRYSVATGKTMRVSKSPRGELAKDLAFGSSISASGRYITFISYGHNLVPGDHNNRADVFRYDATLDETIKVSETMSGAETDGNSNSGVVSPDGRYVAYATTAKNMGPSDTNGSIDTYVYDVLTDTTILASRGLSGSAAGKTTPTDISNGGSIVALSSSSPRLAAADTDKGHDAFLYRARTDSVALVNASAGRAYGADVSADGRWVSYVEFASDAPGAATTTLLLDRNANQRTDIAAPLNGGVTSLSSSGAVAVFYGADRATPTQYGLYLWTRLGG